MNHSNLTLCYEGIQRVYRNAIVGYIRSRIQDAHPTNFAEVLRKPFKEEEWRNIEESARERRHTGEVASSIRDDFDLLGVNHFFNIFDASFDDLCPARKASSNGEDRKKKQALLQWMKSVKSLRDPLSHPSEQDFSFEDSFVLLDCARRVLVQLGLSDAAARVKVLTEQLSGRPLSTQAGTEPLEDRLPPRESVVVRFIGRTVERSRLWEWFLDPSTRRWALAGEGGKGKSAIAYQFATEVKFKAPEPYQIVLWFSAKKTKFQEGVFAEIEEPDFFNLDSALTRLLRQYGWIDEAKRSVERKKQRALELLDAFPALLVVDDIDSLQREEEDAIEFFTFSVPQTKSKVLLTSRRSVFGMGGTTTHVEGFSEKDTRDFIVSRFELMDLDPALANDQLVRDVTKVTEGSPLYIEDLVRLMAIMPPGRAVRAWSEKGGDEARRYALGRELELLSASARHVLVAACIRSGAVSFAELEAVTGFSSDRLGRTLEELQRLFLVPKPRLIEGEQRFDININTRALVLKEEESTELYRRVLAANQAVSGKIPQAGRGEVGAIIRQAVFYVRSKDQVNAEHLLLGALERKVNDPDLMGFLGWVYKTWMPPRVTDAREKFTRAWQLKCANEGMYKHWSQMEINEHEWTKAAEAAERGLRFLPESRVLLYLAGYARGRLGRELTAGLHDEKAREELIKANNYLDRALKTPDSLEPGERELNADIYRALVLNCETLKDRKGMEGYFHAWLGEHPDDPDAKSQWERLSSKYALTLPAAGDRRR